MKTEAKKRIEVNSKAEAWEIIDEIFPTDYMKDEECSLRAGYPIYRSTAEGHYYDYICDLNDRYEVNLSNGKTVNVWFSEEYWKQIEKDEKIAELESNVEELNEEIFFLKEEKKMIAKHMVEASAEVEELKKLIERYEKKFEALKDILS